MHGPAATARQTPGWVLRPHESPPVSVCVGVGVAGKGGCSLPGLFPSLSQLSQTPMTAGPSCALSWLHSKKRAEEVAALRGERMMLTPATCPCHQKGHGNSPSAGGHLSSAVTSQAQCPSSRLTLFFQSNSLASCGRHFLQICVPGLLPVKMLGRRSWSFCRCSS